MLYIQLEGSERVLLVTKTHVEQLRARCLELERFRIEAESSAETPEMRNPGATAGTNPSAGPAIEHAH